MTDCIYKKLTNVYTDIYELEVGKCYVALMLRNDGPYTIMAECSGSFVYD